MISIICDDQRTFDFDPTETALIAIDFQRDFIDPDGGCNSSGTGTERLAAVVPAAQAVVAAARTVGIEEGSSDRCLQQMASGLATATQGLSELRNVTGPLGHGRHPLHASVGDQHRLLSVHTAENIAVILYAAHKRLPLNVRHTRRDFDEDAAINDVVDQGVLVSFDDDTGEVVINEDLKFRPSQILYILDRAAYVDVVSNLPPALEAEEDDGDAVA